MVQAKMNQLVDFMGSFLYNRMIKRVRLLYAQHTCTRTPFNTHCEQANCVDAFVAQHTGYDVWCADRTRALQYLSQLGNLRHRRPRKPIDPATEQTSTTRY